MSRYAIPQPPPPPSQPKNTFEGDQQFLGIQMKLDRDKLPASYLARAENNRMQRGVNEPRGGTITPTFANVVPMDIQGSGLYSNPNGDEVILIATPGETLRIKSGSYPGSATLPAGTVLTGPVEFVQHFDKVLLHRPNGDTTLVWDGSPANAFVPISKSNADDTSTDLMPNPPWSVNFGDRAIFPIPGERDTIGVSDILDYTSYDPILMKFRINRGTADKVVGVYPFSTNNLIVGKTRGLDVLVNFVGDLSNASMEVLTTEVGICARRSGRMVGGDLFYLSADHFGVFRVSEIIQERLQAEPIPVSDSITPVIKRINWDFAEQAVANVHGIYYMLAVPIDGSTVNNALLVYNTVTKEWESAPDRWNAAAQMQLDNLLVTNYFGTPALYAINNGTSGKVHILETGSDDEMNAAQLAGTPPGGIYEMEHLLEMRAFATLGWNGATKRDFSRLEIPVATLRPSITVTALPEGAGDERILNLEPITRNPAKYRNFDRADYVAGNDNQDFEAPGREDYSLDVSTVDFDLTEPGVELEIKQRDVLRFSTKIRGQYAGYRILNTQGKCEVTGLLTESQGTQREQRRAA